MIRNGVQSVLIARRFLLAQFYFFENGFVVIVCPATALAHESKEKKNLRHFVDKTVDFLQVV